MDIPNNCSLRTLQINGQRYEFSCFPMTRLLDALRIQCGLTGAKEGCGEGECGACAVLIDGELVNSCLVPVIQVEGRSISTIEGLENIDNISVLQQAFWESGGAQCGICTPGMIMAAHELLQNNPHPTRKQIQQALAGNLCRCTGYEKIILAVQQAAKTLHDVKG